MPWWLPVRLLSQVPALEGWRDPSCLPVWSSLWQLLKCATLRHSMRQLMLSIRHDVRPQPDLGLAHVAWLCFALGCSAV